MISTLTLLLCVAQVLSMAPIDNETTASEENSWSRRQRDSATEDMAIDLLDSFGARATLAHLNGKFKMHCDCIPGKKVRLLRDNVVFVDWVECPKRKVHTFDVNISTASFGTYICGYEDSDGRTEFEHFYYICDESSATCRDDVHLDCFIRTGEAPLYFSYCVVTKEQPQENLCTVPPGDFCLGEMRTLYCPMRFQSMCGVVAKKRMALVEYTYADCEESTETTVQLRQDSNTVHFAEPRLVTSSSTRFQVTCPDNSRFQKGQVSCDLIGPTGEVTSLGGGACSTTHNVDISSVFKSGSATHRLQCVVEAGKATARVETVLFVFNTKVTTGKITDATGKVSNVECKLDPPMTALFYVQQVAWLLDDTEIEGSQMTLSVSWPGKYRCTVILAAKSCAPLVYFRQSIASEPVAVAADELATITTPPVSTQPPAEKDSDGLSSRQKTTIGLGVVGIIITIAVGLWLGRDTLRSWASAAHGKRSIERRLAKMQEEDPSRTEISTVEDLNAKYSREIAASPAKNVRSASPSAAGTSGGSREEPVVELHLDRPSRSRLPKRVLPVRSTTPHRNPKAAKIHKR